MHSPSISATRDLCGRPADSRRRPAIRYTIVTTLLASAGCEPGCSDGDLGRVCHVMSPTWIWTQVAIVVFVLIGMVIAITKLA